MDSVRVLYSRVTDLHREIDRKRDDVEQATQKSLNHALAGEFDRATDEAALALRCCKEVGVLDLRVIEQEQMIMVAEKRITKLQQQEMAIREASFHHASHITRETKQKIDEITRQLRALRG